MYLVFDLYSNTLYFDVMETAFFPLLNLSNQPLPASDFSSSASSFLLALVELKRLRALLLNTIWLKGMLVADLIFCPDHYNFLHISSLSYIYLCVHWNSTFNCFQELLFCIHNLANCLALET